MTTLSKGSLEKMYIHLNMTDKEIAQKLNLSRSHVSELRKKYSIATRPSTGRKGELLVMSKLNALGFSVKDMNDENQNSAFDVLVDNGIRIDVKSSSYSQKGRYCFRLVESSSKGHAISDIRIKLENGSTKKLYEKTCDYIVFVGLNPNEINEYWVIPSTELNTELQGIELPINDHFESKYSQFYEKWNYLRN